MYKKNKITLFVALLMAIFFSSNAKSRKEDGDSSTKAEVMADTFKGRIDTKVTLEDSTISKYDEKGNLIEKYVYIGGSLTRKFIIKYNEKGERIDYCKYNGDGSLDYKETNKYDERGNIVENCGFTGDGIINYKSTNKYDEKGKNV
ncbi:MAG: hypothetical protein MJZ33_07975 [Paludibacteraceae bacterium]|nr:hypothetical protein [Paludibacteraceae bacterium]